MYQRQIDVYQRRPSEPNAFYRFSGNLVGNEEMLAANEEPIRLLYDRGEVHYELLVEGTSPNFGFLVDHTTEEEWQMFTREQQLADRARRLMEQHSDFLLEESLTDNLNGKSIIHSVQI